MSSGDILAWLEQYEHEVLDRWQAAMREQGLRLTRAPQGEELGMGLLTDAQLREEVHSLYRSFVLAFDRQRWAGDQAYRAERPRQDVASLQLRSIHDISQALGTSLDDAEALTKLVQSLAVVLRTQHCAIWLPDVGSWRAAAMYNEGKTSLTSVSMNVEVHSINVAFDSNQSQVLIKGQSTHASDEQLMTVLHIDALLLVSLAIQDVSIGVITLGRRDSRDAFHSTEVTLVESIIPQVAIAVQNAGLYQETRALNQSLEERVASRTRELAQEKELVETLYAIGRELGASLDLDYVLEKTLELVTEAVGARYGSIMLLDRETDALVYRARLGGRSPLPPQGKPTPFRAGVGIAGWVLQEREPALIHDVLEDDRWLSIEGKSPLTRSLIAAPLMVGDDVHGVLLIADGTPSAFNESHLKLVIAAARQVAQTISNAQLYHYVLESAKQLGQLLRSEQENRSKSQAILQSIADGVIVNDAQFRVIVLNTAAAELLGVGEESVLGQDVRGLFDAFEEEGRRDALATLDVIRTSPAELAGHVVEMTLERNTRVFSAHMAPVITESGESLGVATALRDITHKVEAERAKSEFVSTVSHELRTPLTSIKGYSDLLYAGAVGPVNDSQKRFLGIITNNADRLTALVNDLLDISRIDTGRLKLKIEAVDLVEIICEGIDSLRQQIESKGLRLEVELPDGVCEILGDRIRLMQVVANLLSNALKFTDEGWIRVSLCSLSGAVRLDVADSGMGISMEDQGRVFERFYRADTPIMEDRGGTGLGLAITRQLVELQGGRVWVSSELGTGSTFTVILPAATQELPRSLLSELPAEAKTILVVDDEKDIVALLCHQLETHGYRVITASTGGHAITKAIQEQPDLITLDILLPDRNGFDVLRELKARSETAHIPVIILSVVQDQAQDYALGAVDCIPKPIDEQRLLNSIARTFSHKGKILIAEDSPEAAAILFNLLKSHDYEPLRAVNGYEALALARREQPGLVLLDLRMPGMDGYEALTRLKRDPATRNIPILAMSAHADDAHQVRLKVQEMGAADFLTKPFTYEELLNGIESAVAGTE